ncbi:hypothetical protein [Pseudolysinimonas sp.]|uniref:hypothetical protein n=1 Tax=Pseudolysinimonas sp. TaxID=2680009 RepID=UPI00286C2FEC|nr:hypothetical protein [Pseudolysinimonas sp.]
MRFVVAIVALVLAAAAIGLGVAQRTVLAGPASVSSSVVTGDAPLTVIDAATLNANAGTQSIEVAGEGDIVLAYGRSADVMAWVGDASYNQIGWDAEAQQLTTEVVDGSESAAEIPSVVGSDLWLREFTGTDLLTRKINAPEGISVIIGVDPTALEGTDVTTEAPIEAPVESTEEGAEGTDAAAEPSESLDLSITWPLDNSAPASGPLIVGGIVLLLGGLGAFLWALVHARGTRGPRRSTPKLPKRPKPPQLKPDKRRGAKPTPELEPARSGSGRRRAFVAAGALTAGALLLSGCTVGAQPTPGASETPGFETTPVAVTPGQFANILVDVVATVADADEAKDPALAAERLTGPALALRTANYTIRNADAAVAPIAAIPSETVEVMLPEQTDVWPRRVFAVTRDAGVQAVGVMLTQESPRENYKASYVVTLIASVPDVAPPELGAPALPPSNGLGLLPPEELAAAYGDVLINGEDSEFADLFEAEGDSLREAIGLEYKAERQAALPTSATIAFTNGPGEDPVVAFGTNDSGQIVSVILEDVETVRPVEAGAAVNPAGQVKALSGKAQSTRGIVATYGVQLLLYVPPVSATDQKIVVLGYAQGLVAAVEVG